METAVDLDRCCRCQYFGGRDQGVKQPALLVVTSTIFLDDFARCEGINPVLCHFCDRVCVRLQTSYDFTKEVLFSGSLVNTGLDYWTGLEN